MTAHRRDVLKGIGIAGTPVLAGTGLATALDSGTARLRVVHASPDAPNVDVFVDGSRVLSDVPFDTVSRYLEVPSGDRTVRITVAGDPSTVAFEGSVHVRTGSDYTIAAIGELSEGTFRPLVRREFNEEFSDRFAVFRVAHASPDAPAVDVTLEGGQFTLYSGVEFGDVTRYRALPAREFGVEIRPAGGGNPVATATLDLRGNTTYTAFATGYLSPADEPGDASLGLLPAVSGGGDEEEGPGSGTGRLRVAHASPDAPAVDVFVDGSKVLSGVSFTTISDYLEVPAGDRPVRITAASDPSTVVFEGPVTVAADTAYTVAAIGELTAETFRPVVLVDDADPEDGSAALRVLHASPDAPAVDVTADDGGSTLVDGLHFGDASGYASLSPGTYRIEVRPDSDGNDNPFDAEFGATLSAGATTAIATGYFTAFDEPTDEQFTLALATDATAE